MIIIELINDLNNERNSEMLVKYLSDCKVGKRALVTKLPADLQRKLDYGLLMISRTDINSRTEVENEPSDEQEERKYDISSNSEIKTSSFSLHEIEEYTPVDIVKPLLISKRKTSKFVFQQKAVENLNDQELPVSHTYDDRYQATKKGKLAHKILKSKSDNEFMESLLNKRTKSLIKSKTKGKVRETDPILSKSKIFA
jgi:hypothetical protein